MKKLLIAVSISLLAVSAAQAGWLNFGNKKHTTTTTTMGTDVAQFVPWRDMSPVRKIVEKNAEYINSCMQYMEREEIVCGRYVER